MPQGRKRRKASDETPKTKKRRAIQAVEAEYVPSANDLISDVPRDENVTINTLLPDLATSYVGRFKSPAAPPRAKRKSWPRQSSPLIDPEGLPPGWSMTEPDLDRNDIEAQIERCHGLRIAQAKRNALAESEPGTHSLHVLRRLENLRNIEVELQSSDNFNQLPNVRALLQAYRGGILHWNSGLVTYWFEGVQLCEPRPFSWDEFEVLNAHHSGKTGFWMEGLVGPGPTYSLAAIGLPGAPPPDGYFTRAYVVAVRIPGTRWYAEFDFLYDTGASIMSIYEGDILNLMGTSTVEPTVMGLNTVEMADGTTMTGPVVELEVTILDNERRRMTRWVRVQCQVYRGWSNGTQRLDGPWLRHVLYTASAPHDNDMMWLANTYPDIMDALPNTGNSQRGEGLDPARLPLDPGGRASVMPRGRPGADSEPPPVLYRKLPGVAP
ncbi:unnamed protein product [Penicillium glandicola]